MKKILTLVMTIILIFSCSSCGKEISADNDIVWMTEDGSSWFVCGSLYGRAVLNGFGYSEAALTNYKYGLVFCNKNCNALKFDYKSYGDYIKVTCTRDVDGEIGVGTEFIFYPHDRNEDSAMMASWRESVDVKSDTLWMTKDGTSWFIHSETREEAVIEGNQYYDLDTSDFPNTLYLKRDGKYVVILSFSKYVDDGILFWCSFDENDKFSEAEFVFYPHTIEE